MSCCSGYHDNCGYSSSSSDCSHGRKHHHHHHHKKQHHRRWPRELIIVKQPLTERRPRSNLHNRLRNFLHQRALPKGKYGVSARPPIVSPVGRFAITFDSAMTDPTQTTWEYFVRPSGPTSKLLALTVPQFSASLEIGSEELDGIPTTVCELIICSAYTGAHTFTTGIGEAEVFRPVTLVAQVNDQFTALACHVGVICYPDIGVAAIALAIPESAGITSLVVSAQTISVPVVSHETSPIIAQ